MLTRLQAKRQRAGAVLAAVMYAAPCLMMQLSPESRAVLSACSRELRTLTRNVTRVIHLKGKQDPDAISIKLSSWPHLALVTLPKGLLNHPADISCQTSRQLALAAAVGFDLLDTCEQPRHGMNLALIIAPQQQSKWPQTHCLLQQLSPAFLHLSQPCYHQVKRLAVRRCSLDAEGIAQLAKIPWPQLVSLDVSDNGLGSNAISQLATGCWPLLRQLDVSLNMLDQGAMDALVRAAWPKLAELSLGGPVVKDPAATNCLGAADWPMLKDLSLAGCSFSQLSMCRLVQMD